MTSDAARSRGAMPVPPPSRERAKRARRPIPPGWVGWVCLLGAAGGFTGLAADVAGGGPASSLDQAVAGWFHLHRSTGFTAAMHVATGLGSTSWMLVASLALALALAWRRRWLGLLAFSLAVPGGMGVNVILKHLFHRPRSGPEPWSQSFPGYGFPSGHTMAATLLYGALAVWAIAACATRREQAGAVFGAGALVGLVGLSRLELGAHYLTDVLAAAAAGFVWLVLCYTAVDGLRRLLAGRRHA